MAAWPRANGFVYSADVDADADADFVYSADSVQTCDDWYTNGHFLLFDCFWLFLTIGTLLLHCWYSLDRPVTIGTPMVIFVLFWLSFDCFWLFLTIGTLLVQSW